MRHGDVHAPFRCVARLLVAVAVVMAVGCEQRPDSRQARAGSPRVISLSPALTQMVLDLGAGQSVVGVGRFDPLADRGVPIVGDLNQYDYEKLVSLDPTVLLLQPPASGVPAKLQDLARGHGWRLRAYGIDTVADAKRALYSPRGRGVGEAIGRRDAARALRERIEYQLAQISVLTLERRPPEVMLLVSVGSQVTAAGRDTFLDELLTFAGGTNAVTAGGYPTFDRERLVALDPNAVVITHTSDKPTPTGPPPLLADLDIEAVRRGRVYWLADPQALLPSTTMPRIAGKLAKLLHPQLAQDIEAILAEHRPPRDGSVSGG